MLRRLNNINFGIFILVMICTAILSTAVPSNAATSMFLKISGIPGDVTDKAHADEHAILSYSLGMSQSGTFHTGGGGTAGKVSIQDLSVTKEMNKGSTALRLACATGQHIPEVVLTLQRGAGADKPFIFWKLTLTKVLVSSITSGASAVDSIPLENITFNFAKIEWEFTEQKADGTAGGTFPGGWDIEQNIEL